MPKPTYYEILGIGPDASEDEIKKVFRTLAREFHPDVNPSPDAEDKFKQINLAYATLSDSLKRADYDQTLFGGVRGADETAPEGTPGDTTARPGTYEDPNRQALIRAGLARSTVAGLVGAVIGATLQLAFGILSGTDAAASSAAIGAIPGLGIGLLIGADLNFKVETFLGSGWIGRSYTFIRTIIVSLGLGYFGGLLGAAIDRLIGGPRIATVPLILLGILVGAVVGSDGDTPDKIRSGAGRFNLFYTLVRGAQVGLIGAVIGAGLGGILAMAGLPGLFGWNVFAGFSLGMIVGSIKPPNLAAYASYASASVKNVIVILMVLGALLVGMGAGLMFGSQFDLLAR